MFVDALPFDAATAAHAIESFTCVTAWPCFVCVFVFFVSCAALDAVARRWPHLRIQEAQESPEKMGEMAAVAIYNVMLGAWIVTCLHPITAQFMRVGEFDVRWQLATLVAMLIASDANFYWSHRLLHHPLVYKRWHKLHHTCKHPVPWTSLYVAPGEFFVAILSSFLMPLWFAALVGLYVPQMTPHYHTYAAYLAIATFSLVMSHDGMRLPLLDASHHDRHHLHFVGNYGTRIGVWDWLMGTKASDAPAKPARKAVVVTRPVTRSMTRTRA